MVRAGLEPGISGSQGKRPNHWATLAPADDDDDDDDDNDTHCNITHYFLQPLISLDRYSWHSTIIKTVVCSVAAVVLHRYV